MYHVLQSLCDNFNKNIFYVYINKMKEPLHYITKLYRDKYIVKKIIKKQINKYKNSYKPKTQN